MEEPDAQEGTLHVKPGIQLGDGDERHLQRHDLQTDQQGKQPLAAFEVQPGKGVGGQHGEDDHQQGGRDGDGQRVQPAIPIPAGLARSAAVAVEDTPWYWLTPVWQSDR